jgi:flagellar hook-length control protein FliK
MKISNTEGAQTPSYQQQSSGGTKDSSKFDRVLDARRKQRDDKPKDDSTKGKPDTQQPNASQQEIPTAFDQPINWKAEQTSARVSETTSSIQNLSGEIVGELRSVAHQDGAHTIDIQFDSKTLDGLHVQLAAQGDVLSLRFDTASHQVAGLLSDRTHELTTALERKGFRVNGLVINAKGKNQSQSAQIRFRSRDRSPNG